MGEADKGLQLLKCTPIKQLAPRVSGMILRGNRNIEGYEALAVLSPRSEIEGIAGALADVQAALNYFDTEYVVRRDRTIRCSCRMIGRLSRPSICNARHGFGTRRSGRP